MNAATAAAVTADEADVRAFAEQFPTPNVKAALAYAESGRLTWAQVAGLARKALAAGLASV